MAAWAANSARASSSSGVNSPASLLITSNAPNRSPVRAAQRNAQQRARLVAELAIDLPIDRASARVACSTRRGWPVAITWPTTPRSSGTRSSPPLTPKAGRPTSIWLGRSQRKMLARSAPTSRVAASAICTSSGSISRVWFHWLAISRIVSRRRIRWSCRCRRRTEAKASRSTGSRASTSAMASGGGALAQRTTRASEETARAASGPTAQLPCNRRASRSRASASRSTGSATGRSRFGQAVPLSPVGGDQGDIASRQVRTNRGQGRLQPGARLTGLMGGCQQLQRQIHLPLMTIFRIMGRTPRAARLRLRHLPALLGSVNSMHVAANPASD